MDLEFLDLDSGERIPFGDDVDWEVIGPELALIDNGSLVVGWDPFDPSAETSTIELPAGTVEVDASDDGRTIVATVQSELVGIVDGEEAWRWTPDVESFDDIEVFDGYVGVEDHSYGWVNLAQFARFGDDGVEPFDVLPKEFDVTDVWLEGDSDALVGIFNQEPGFFTEGDLLTAVELEAATPTHQVAEGLGERPGVGVFGPYVFAASIGQLEIYEGVELEGVSSVPLSEESEITAVGDAIIIYDPEQSTFTVYA